MANAAIRCIQSAIEREEGAKRYAQSELSELESQASQCRANMHGCDTRIEELKASLALLDGDTGGLNG